MRLAIKGEDHLAFGGRCMNNSNKISIIQLGEHFIKYLSDLSVQYRGWKSTDETNAAFSCVCVYTYIYAVGAESLWLYEQVLYSEVLQHITNEVQVQH